MSDMAAQSEQSYSEAQRDALSFLTSIYGKPIFVNAARPSVAVHADFGPCDAYPYGSAWRIEPDGAIDDITDALIEGYGS